MRIPDIQVPLCPTCGDPVTSGCYPADGICAVVEDEQPDAWSVSKIRHDENAAVGPNIIGDWIYRAAGQSDVEHTRQYAAQLLAAADELERRQQVTTDPRPNADGAP